MKIGIIGGGLMGLTTALRLSGEGKEVHVFERGSQWGGLATYHDYGDFVFDRFYHVILPGDRYLLALLDELGLTDHLYWRQTRTGYYVDQQFYSISNSWEFLTFPPLSWWSKFRLACTLIYGARLRDGARIADQTIEQWLVKIGGRQTFERFWKPLLLAKLGSSYRRVSATFIWTYIKRLFEARGDQADRVERMGQVQGGYHTVFQRMQDRLTTQGVRLHLDCPVEHIAPAEQDQLHLYIDGTAQTFDRVIFTGPANVLTQIADSRLVTIAQAGEEVEYLGVLCLVLATRRKLTPFYVCNLADERLPFTGVIGMSNLVDPEQTGGYFLTYFPQYLLSTDARLRVSDAELTAEFLAGVRRLFPALRTEEIAGTWLHRAFKVQPLPLPGQHQAPLPIHTQHSGFFVLNTAQFVNDTLNNNSVARHVMTFMEAYGDHFR